MGGYRPGSGRAKSGYYRGIYCGSTYELVWVIYQFDHNKEFERFSGLLEYNGRKYIPDFLQDGKIIEIKGYEPQNLVDEKTLVAQHHGYDVIVLRKEDLRQEFEWVKKTYSYKNVFELYDGYKPKYEYECSCCSEKFVTDNKRRKEEKFCSRTCAGKFRHRVILADESVRQRISDTLRGKSRGAIAPYKRRYRQIWVTNGTVNTRIPFDSPIPDGFTRGHKFNTKLADAAAQSGNADSSSAISTNFTFIPV